MFYLTLYIYTCVLILAVLIVASFTTTGEFVRSQERFTFWSSTVSKSWPTSGKYITLSSHGMFNVFMCIGYVKIISWSKVCTQMNCSSYSIVFHCVYRVMCSTINAVPETQSLLSKLKLPLGIHIHPYQTLTIQVCIYT